MKGFCYTSPMEKLTPERLREVVDYDPETGEFTRKVRLAQRHQVGDRADKEAHGTLAGYRQIAIDRKKYLAHRCAWLFMHGKWPTQQIDHINGNRSDNRIANLRSVSEAVNHQNLRGPKRNNKSGFLGVVFHPGSGRWRASVTFNRRVYRFGLHDTPEQAHAAYLVAKRKLHEGCTI